jgi:hypothetical protein
MALETLTPTTRRNVLAAAFGALAAFAAQAIGRPLPARAEGEAIVVGGEYTDATSVTKIANTTTSDDVLWGESSFSGTGVFGGSGSGAGVFGFSQSGDGVRGIGNFNIGVSGFTYATGQPAVLGQALGDNSGVLGFSGSGEPPGSPAKTGVYGYAAQDSSAVGVSGKSTEGTGVWGLSTSGIAVRGASSSGAGVLGYSGSYVGVRGDSAATDQPASLGWSTGDSTGVQGYSGTSSVPPAPAKTGVYGTATQDANARGVRGDSLAGRGVHGQATTGRGIHGQATTGTGVYAIATTGTALRAEGAVRFKTSGLATIAADTRSVVVTPAGLDVTTSSKILALLQGDAGGSTTVQRVAINASANTFTIYLTANAVRAVKVSWFVIS